MARSRGTMLNEERQEATRGGESVVASIREDRPPVVAEQPARAAEEQPAWVVEELPPEYGEIARKIAKLREEAHSYEKFAEVLWRRGQPLKLGVRDVFAALGFKTDLSNEAASYDLVVALDPQRRLLVEVLAGVSPFDKKSPDITRALRAIQEDAGPGDRVVFVANIPCDKPVAMRQEVPAAPDALRLIQGLGVNLVATSTLFGFWRYSLQDLAGARTSVDRLHALDGGIFK